MQHSQLSRALCSAHARRCCVLTATGTIALVLALKARGLEGARVVVPSGVCLNVPLAVHYADAIPLYCDIDRRTLGLSVDALRLFKPRPKAVIAVHAYGAICDIEPIADYCRNAGIFLIEDLATAQGAKYDGRPAGSYGDCSVMSFGTGKIIDVGAGGALLTDDGTFADAVARLHGALPPRTSAVADQLDQFSDRHTRLYNEHFGMDLEQYAPAFLRHALGLKDLVLSRPPCDFDSVANKLAVLAQNLARRARLAGMLHDRFESAARRLLVHHPPHGSVYWRFNVFSVARDLILKTLLREQMRISSWFPSADLFLGGRMASGANTPVSDAAGNEILNIWVNHEVDESYVTAIADRIQALA